MLTIRVILYKYTRVDTRYVAHVLYVDHPDGVLQYTDQGYLTAVHESFAEGRFGDITIEQASDDEAIELLDKLRGHYNVLVTRAPLRNPPKNLIVSREDLLPRI